MSSCHNCGMSYIGQAVICGNCGVQLHQNNESDGEVMTSNQSPLIEMDDNHSEPPKTKELQITLIIVWFSFGFLSNTGFMLLSVFPPGAIPVLIVASLSLWVGIGLARFANSSRLIAIFLAIFFIFMSLAGLIMLQNVIFIVSLIIAGYIFYALAIHEETVRSFDPN